MDSSTRINDNGKWWIQNKPHIRVNGLLKFDNENRFILELYDVPGDFYNEKSAQTPLIFFGETINQKYTLYDCHLIGRRWGQFTNLNFSAREVISGFHLEKQNKDYFQYIYLEFDGIDNWIDIYGISENKKQNINSFEIKYEQPEDVNLTFLKYNLKISFVIQKPYFFQTRKLNINESIIFQVSKEDSNFSLNEARELSFKLLSFFSLCTLRYSKLSNLSVVNDGNFGNYYYELNYINLENADRYLFDFKLIQEELAECLKNWFEKYKLLDTTINLYLASQYLQMTFESSFLFLCQAFESYVNNFYECKYMSDEGFGDIYDIFKKAIPTELDKSMRDSIKNKIKFFNEYSLIQKFKYICSFEKENFSFLFRDPKVFFRELVDYRNYLTHRSSNKNSNLDYSKLIDFYLGLLVVLEFCFLIELGFDSERINKIMKSCNHFRYRRKYLYQ